MDEVIRINKEIDRLKIKHMKEIIKLTDDHLAEKNKIREQLTAEFKE